MSSYSFPISSFIVGNGANSTLLYYQIEISNITTSINKLYGTVSTVEVSFNSVLSGSEETTLNNIVATHDPDTQAVPFGDNELQIKINETESSTVYTNVASIVWPPTFPFEAIIALKFISNLETGTSYDVRLFNYRE